MKRVEIEADQMPGQDSFLDVITNIVGILILLVLVVGLRTSKSVREAPDSAAGHASYAQENLQQVYSSALTTEFQVREAVRKASDVHNEADFREAERQALVTAITEVEQKLAEQRSKLSTEGQRDFDLRQKLNEAQTKLDELAREQIVLISQEGPSEELECQPTPLAKFVKGKEIHVLLSEDHLALIPFDELIEAMKADIKENMWRLQSQDELVRTIGPIEGFRLKYCFNKEDVMRASAAGTYMMGTICRFSHCYFLPVTTPAGEPAADSLGAQSELMQLLSRERADGTTVTFWVHPGNYDRLLGLKRAVRDRGFQVAVRPLPKGVPMGAARDGTKSLVE